jgi:hypothetical protein
MLQHIGVGDARKINDIETVRHVRFFVKFSTDGMYGFARKTTTDNRYVNITASTMRAFGLLPNSKARSTSLHSRMKSRMVSISDCSKPVVSALSIEIVF